MFLLLPSPCNIWFYTAPDHYWFFYLGERHLVFRQRRNLIAVLIFFHCPPSTPSDHRSLFCWGAHLFCGQAAIGWHLYCALLCVLLVFVSRGSTCTLCLIVWHTSYCLTYRVYLWPPNLIFSTLCINAVLFVIYLVLGGQLFHFSSVY